MEIYAAHLIPMPNGLSFSATIKCSELCQARLLNKFCMWLIKPDSRRYKKIKARRNMPERSQWQQKLNNRTEHSHLYLPGRYAYKVPDTKLNTHPITHNVLPIWCQEQRTLCRTCKAIFPLNSFIIRHLPGHNPESFPLPAGKIWLNLSSSTVFPFLLHSELLRKESSSSSDCATMTKWVIYAIKIH